MRETRPTFVRATQACSGDRNPATQAARGFGAPGLRGPRGFGGARRGTLDSDRPTPVNQRQYFRLTGVGLSGALSEVSAQEPATRMRRSTTGTSTT
ncbi:hypothetical protein FrEUN1fDRAFT_3118 [Parafrankia sp. EUN1f]|nr:hypothetical protein FrEUN1fDRAFT_3118 [Parafrankia sp. EUN1f]